MNIGIIGSGVVGQELGYGFIRIGHQVKIGSRNPEKLNEWISKAGTNASSGTLEDTVHFGDLLILATKWSGTMEAIDLAGRRNFEGKIMIDVTNPLDFSSGKPKLVSSQGSSAGEIIQDLLPDTKVVKAFNFINAAIMHQAAREEGVPDFFLCGNDIDAKKIVSEFATQFGWASVEDIGEITESYLLEAYAMLWINYAMRHGTITHAFKLLRK